MSFSDGLSITATVMGALITVVGVNGLTRPVWMARTFGLRSASPAEATFMPVLGGRNLCIGLTLLTLTYMGERKAVGTSLMYLGAIAGGTDIVYCFTKCGGNDWPSHIIGTGVLLVAGSGLLGWW